MTTIKFDSKCKCGAEFVCIRIIDNCDTLEVGGIVLSKKVNDNNRLAFGKIENIGATAAAEYGLTEGDYVYFDRLSTFAHTEPVCLLKYNNIICKTNENRSIFTPLRNMLFVKPDSLNNVTNVNGIYVKDYTEKLNTGTITAINFDDELNSPFKVGDKVILSKGGDVVETAECLIHVYKHDMIIASIEG